MLQHPFWSTGLKAIPRLCGMVGRRRAWGLGAGRRRLWPLWGGPYTKWKEDCQARPCSNILCPSFWITYRGRSKVSLEEADWAGPLPLPLTLPRPFLVNVYLALPAQFIKSIYYLSGRHEGQQMKLPVTRTSFGPHLGRGPKLSRYLQGPAGLIFPGLGKWTHYQTLIPCRSYVIANPTLREVSK